MAILRNWSFSSHNTEDGGVFLLHGTVYGHSSARCPDGLYIHTSRVESIALMPDKLLVHTHNTDYQCTFDSVNADANRHYAFECCIHEFIKDSEEAERIISMFDTQQAAREAKIQEAKKLLVDNEIYVCLSSDSKFYFDKAFTREHSLDMIPHIGTMQDSVLVGEFEANSLTLRYFPYKDNNIEFYNTSRGDVPTPKGDNSDEYVIDIPPADFRFGYLKNTGIQPLHVRLFNKVIDLAPDEEIEISANAVNAHEFGKMTSLRDLYEAEGMPEGMREPEDDMQLRLGMLNAHTQEEALEFRESWLKSHPNCLMARLAKAQKGIADVSPDVN